MNEFIFQLVNRQNGSKLKPTMSTIYDEEVVKHTSSHRSSDYSKPVHTIWTDPDVSWNDKSFESTSNKVNFAIARSNVTSRLHIRHVLILDLSLFRFWSTSPSRTTKNTICTTVGDPSGTVIIIIPRTRAASTAVTTVPRTYRTVTIPITTRIFKWQ